MTNSDGNNSQIFLVHCQCTTVKLRIISVANLKCFQIGINNWTFTVTHCSAILVVLEPTKCSYLTVL